MKAIPLFATLIISTQIACFAAPALATPVALDFSSGLTGTNSSGRDAYREQGFIFEALNDVAIFSVGSGHLTLRNPGDEPLGSSFRFSLENGQTFNFLSYQDIYDVEGVPQLTLRGSNGAQITSACGNCDLDSLFTNVSWIDFDIHALSPTWHATTGLSAIMLVDNFHTEVTSIDIPSCAPIPLLMLGLSKYLAHRRRRTR